MDLIGVEAVLVGPAAAAGWGPAGAGGSGPGSSPGTAPVDSGWRAGDVFLAGGTWLLSEPQPRARRLRDLTTLGWPPITLTRDALVLAATCTLGELRAFRSPPGWAGGALIRQCCDALLGSFKVAAVATVGGNLCLSLPAAPMTSLATTLDGEVVLWDAAGGRRTLAVADFVTGDGRNALRPGELLRELRLPLAALAERTSFSRFSLNTGGRSAGLVAGRADAQGRTVISVTASTVRPVVLRFPAPPVGEQVRAALAGSAPQWTDDVHGLPVWREAMTLRALEQVRSGLAA